MIFTQTRLAGAFIIDIEKLSDARGFFAREFCAREFAAHGLKTEIPQVGMAHNIKAGTIRGMHFQYPPAAETKLVRCLSGALLDVIVDLRPESPTFLEHVAVELSEDNWRALYVPERFAHGYQTLRDGTIANYHLGAFYAPECEGGLRYDDPRLGISWPLPVSAISDKDKGQRTYVDVGQTLKRRMTAA